MKHQTGNILFLILIAVALFAALSYAITSSSRTGQSTISKDKAKLAASQILQYGAKIEQTISKLRLINGCTDTQISFERAPFDSSDPYYVNPLAPPDFRCHIFHPNGGGQSPLEFQSEWRGQQGLTNYVNELFFTGNDCIPAIGSGKNSSCWNNNTSDDTDLKIVTADIADELCDQINELLDITKGSQGAGLGDYYNQSTPDNSHGGFKGVYTNGTSPIQSGHIVSNPGKAAACYTDLQTNANNFYYVVIAR